MIWNSRTLFLPLGKTRVQLCKLPSQAVSVSTAFAANSQRSKNEHIWTIGVHDREKPYSRLQLRVKHIWHTQLCNHSESAHNPIKSFSRVTRNAYIEIRNHNLKDIQFVLTPKLLFFLNGNSIYFWKCIFCRKILLLNMHFCMSLNLCQLEMRLNSVINSTFRILTMKNSQSTWWNSTKVPLGFRNEFTKSRRKSPKKKVKGKVALRRSWHSRCPGTTKWLDLRLNPLILRDMISRLKSLENKQLWMKSDTYRNVTVTTVIVFAKNKWACYDQSSTSSFWEHQFLSICKCSSI